MYDAVFILCTGFIIYFTFKALIQAFAIYGFSRGNSFLLNIYIIMIYLNFLVNLLYLYAVLWIPTKIKYSMPLSLRS